MGMVTFKSLYEKYFSALVYFSFRIIQDKDLANDCVQEAFIIALDQRIFESIREKYPHAVEQVFKSWIYRTVRNETLNLVQTEKRRDDRIKIINYVLPEYEHGDLCEDMIRAEVARQLWQAVDSLPAHCKKVFIKHYIENKELNEVAAELEISSSTVKNQKVRGLDILRKYFHTSKEEFEKNMAILFNKIKNSDKPPAFLSRLYGVPSSTVDQLRRGATKTLRAW